MTQRLQNSLQAAVKLLLSFLLLTIWSEQASAWDYEAVKRIESATALPQQPDREVVVTRYGASPKASAVKNQKAINRAIAEMAKSGGGRVVIPAGTWHTGALRLLSHVNLVVSKGATLCFVFDTKLYPLVKTSWEELECWNYSPCIYAYQATDIAITGEGTVDGGGSNATWWAMCGKERFGYKAGVTKEAQSLGSRDRLQKMAEDGVDPDKRRFGRGQGLRPQLINVMQCERVLIKGVRLINSPFWVIHPLLSKSITVDNVKIWNEGSNGDGCDPEACENVIIKNCSFHTGDDCIAIKSGRNNDGRLWQKPARNIIIRNCKMEDGHGAVVIGSEISGGCQNVFAEDCMMDSPNLERVLRIKTNNCRGGVIENINMRNIKVGQCSEAVLKIKAGSAVIEHSVTIKGIYPTAKPTIQGTFKLQAGASLTLSNLVLDGTSNAANDQFFDYKSAGNYKLLDVEDCEIIGANDQKGLLYGNTDQAIIDNVVFRNNKIHGIGCDGGDFFDVRKSYIKDITFVNNTVYNCANERDLFRYDDKASNYGNPVPVITVKNNTFYNVMNATSGKRFLYIRFNGKKGGQQITWANNLIVNTQAVYTNQSTTTTPAYQNNYYFGCANANLFAASDPENKLYWNGDTSGKNGTDPKFKDAAKGDFTVGNEDVSKLGVGVQK